MQTIVVTPELQAYIDPLTPDEYAALERSILAEGCRDALVLWGDILVDGHNRYSICTKHGLPFQTVQNTRFQSMEDVHLWMIDQHLGRRSVSDFQRGVLALRKREILAERRAMASQKVPAPDTGTPAPDDAAAPAVSPTADTEPLNTREAIARAARLSSSQVVLIEKIQKQAAPEVVAAVKAGDLSLNAAAAVAALPAEEQTAAAAAGKDSLREAAKRVRDAKKKAKAPAPAAEASADAHSEAAPPASEAVTEATGADELQALRARVAELTAENAALRQQLAQLLAG